MTDLMTMGSALDDAFSLLDGPMPAPRDEQYLQAVLLMLARQNADEARLERAKATFLQMVEQHEAKLKARREKIEQDYLPPAQRVTQELLEGQKRKSINLVIGTVGFRTNPGSIRWQPEDEAALLAYVREHVPQAVVVKESVSKKALKDYIESTGDIPPGVVLEEGKEVFYCKPTMEAPRLT